MSHQAQFDEKGCVVWEERPSPPPDLSRFQKAMFLDRPDLWPKQPGRRKPGSKPLDGQIVLFSIDGDCPDGRCKDRRKPNKQGGKP